MSIQVSASYCISQVIPFLHAIHSNSQFHPEPDRFNPDRFMSGKIPSQFIPFQVGKSWGPITLDT